MNPDPRTAPSGRTGTGAAPLGRRALFSYALPSAPVQFLYMLFLFMYLKYAAESLGASTGTVGTIFLVARVWDAISDPLVGNLSDRTTLAFGRRKSWLLGSALPLLLFGVMAWVPPPGLEGPLLTAWISVAIVGFYTAYTAFEVPHIALGAEISLDPLERNKIYGARQLARALAMLLSAAGVQLLMDDERSRESAYVLALGCGAFAVAAIVYGIWALPPERRDYAGRGGASPFRAAADVVRNVHARLLLSVYFIEQLGMGAIGMLVPFLLQYVIVMPEITGAMLGSTFVLSILSIPVWIAFARRFEKRRLWLAAMIVTGLGYGMLLFFGAGTWLLMAVSCTIVGLCQSCGSVLGQSLKAEIVDYDELQTGERKEGIYFAAWTFASKLAAGIMAFVAGWVLELAGFVPDGEVQSDRVQWAMLLLAGGMPLAGFSIGALAFTRFSLNEVAHARIRAQLDGRA
ncbi:MAG: MFS transporter [Myxococcota bacterium]